MALGSITVDLLLRTGSFATSTKQAEKSLQGLKTSAIGMGKAIHTAIAAAASSAPIVALKETINAMDEMSKSAQKVGITTEEFSKLNYAAGLADVSMETLVGSLGKLTKAQAAALDSTSQQAKVFDALGIAVNGSDGKLRDSTDVLADFADRFKELEGSPEAMAAGFAIFGRSFQEMIPLLKDGGAGIREAGDELESFGGVLSTNAGRQAEAFNDNLTRLKTIAQSLGLSIASDLLPDLVKLSEQFVGTASDGAKLAETSKGIGDGIREVATFAKQTYDALEILRAGLKAFELQGNAAFQSLNPANWNTKDLDRLYKQYTSGANAVNEAVKSATGGEPRTSAGRSRRGGGPMNMTPSTGGVTQAEVDAYTRKLQAALAGTDKANKAVTKSSKEAKDAAQEAIDAYNEIYGSVSDSADSQIASLEQEIALWGNISEAARTSYEIQYGSLKGISQAQAEYLMSLAQTRDALDDYDAIYGDVADAAKESTDKMSSFADEAARNMQDSFADFLFDPFKDGASGMLKNFTDVLRRMAAEAAASQILKQVGSWASNYTGSGSSWINAIGGALTKNASGGVYNSPGLSGYSNSIVSKPTLFAFANGAGLMGEAGPEAIMPLTRAPNGKLGVQSTGSGDVNIEIINNGNPVTADVSRSQAPDGSQLIKLVLNAVADDIGSGGRTSSAMKRRFGLREAV